MLSIRYLLRVFHAIESALVADTSSHGCVVSRDGGEREIRKLQIAVSYEERKISSGNWVKSSRGNNIKQSGSKYWLGQEPKSREAECLCLKLPRAYGLLLMSGRGIRNSVVVLRGCIP